MKYLFYILLVTTCLLPMPYQELITPDNSMSHNMILDVPTEWIACLNFTFLVS